MNGSKRTIRIRARKLTACCAESRYAPKPISMHVGERAPRKLGQGLVNERTVSIVHFGGAAVLSDDVLVGVEEALGRGSLGEPYANAGGIVAVLR